MNWCEVFLLDVTGLEQSEELLSRLSALRQEKVRAYSHEAGRRLSLGAGLLLDAALRRHGMRERDVEYCIGEHGKPDIKDKGQGTKDKGQGTKDKGQRTTAALHFNLSHSGTMVTCALASCPVGVDIEKSSRRISDALLHRVCNDREVEEVRRDALRFFDLWTAKEAVLKLTGEGISGDLRQLDISRVHTWRRPEGYALSVALGTFFDSGSITFEECFLPLHTQTIEADKGTGCKSRADALL